MNRVPFKDSGLDDPFRSTSRSAPTLDDRVRSLESSAVRRLNPGRSRLVEKVAPSGIYVPRTYGNALGSDLRRTARPIGVAVLSASLAALSACGEVNEPPPDPDPDPDPVCDVNPIEQIASDAGVPYEWVRVLGEDCEVDADERWFVEKLPELLERTTETITRTYPERFVDDDGEFEPDEKRVLSRFLDGRVNHAGVQITPGYLAMFDENESNPETRLVVPPAPFVPLFATPFDRRVIPGFQNNGYGEPYFSDGGLESASDVYLPNRGDDRTFLDLLGSALQPQPDATKSDAGPGTQFIFAQDQALVNGLPHPVRVENIRYLENFGRDGTMVRNATLDFVPVSRSPSLGFQDLSSWVVHADPDRLLVSVGDVVMPEQIWGYSELELGGGIQVKWGFYTSDGHIGDGGPFTVLDPWDPSIGNPQSRGLVLEVALYRALTEENVPTFYLGSIQQQAVKDGRSMADGTFAPLIYTPQ